MCLQDAATVFMLELICYLSPAFEMDNRWMLLIIIFGKKYYFHHREQNMHKSIVVNVELLMSDISVRSFDLTLGISIMTNI